MAPKKKFKVNDQKSNHHPIPFSSIPSHSLSSSSLANSISHSTLNITRLSSSSSHLSSFDRRNVATPLLPTPPISFNAGSGFLPGILTFGSLNNATIYQGPPGFGRFIPQNVSHSGLEHEKADTNANKTKTGQYRADLQSIKINKRKETQLNTNTNYSKPPVPILPRIISTSTANRSYLSVANDGHSRSIQNQLNTHQFSLNNMRHGSGSNSVNPNPSIEDKSIKIPVPSHFFPLQTSNPFWSNKCFNCLDESHFLHNCKKVRSCVACRCFGHTVKDCDLVVGGHISDRHQLNITGTKGDEGMPPRPKFTTVFIKHTRRIKSELQNLRQSVVIDGSRASIQSRTLVYELMANSYQWKSFFKLSHFNGPRYLLELPRELTRTQLLSYPLKPLRQHGFLIYPWTAAIGGESHDYPFKVWLNLKDVPGGFWESSALAGLVSTAGVLLDNGPLKNVRSREWLMLLIGTDDLARIPLEFRVIAHSFRYVVPIQVAGIQPRTFDSAHH